MRGRTWVFLYVGMILLVFSTLVISPSNAFASSIAGASATLDWTGFEVSLSSNLSLTTFLYSGSSQSQANTYLFGDPPTLAASGESKYRQFNLPGFGTDDWPYTSAALASSGPAGTASAQGSTANGFVASGALTAWVDPPISLLGASPNENRASSFAGTGTFSFSVAGTGTGTVSISVPYTLSVFCNASNDGVAKAFGSVGLSGIGYPTNQQSTASCDEVGAITRSGSLTISQSYTFPGTSFPYVPGLIQISAFTDATSGTTKVSEPSTALLLFVSAFTCLATMAKARSKRPPAA